MPELKAEREGSGTNLLDLTIGGEDANRTRCIMEIRAGTGGEEAALFARDLYEMYSHYAEGRRWKIEVLDIVPTELGGFKEIIIGVEGEGVFRATAVRERRPSRAARAGDRGQGPHPYLGRHRGRAGRAGRRRNRHQARRLPQGHFHASGPGGQHVNKTASAIRLTHYETGIVVSCQDEKSQHKNLAKALRVLKTRLYESNAKQEHKKRSDERKSKIGSGDRSERIRTYNFPQNRVTDHRIGLTLYKLDQIMAGDLHPVIDALMEYERQEQRATFGTID